MRSVISEYMPFCSVFANHVQNLHRAHPVQNRARSTSASFALAPDPCMLDLHASFGVDLAAHGCARSWVGLDGRGHSPAFVSCAAGSTQ